jgi:hypothetical protein
MALLRVNDEKVIRVLCIQKLSFHIIIILFLKTCVHMCFVVMGCGIQYTCIVEVILFINSSYVYFISYDNGF